MTIGERIKNRRIELNMTQQQLADKLGYKDRSAVCQVERDKNNTITTDRISAFASALDVSPSYLMGWVDNSDPDYVPTLRDHFKKSAKIMSQSILDTPAPFKEFEEFKEDQKYYENEETATIAQELLENPNLRLLFDAAKDSRPEDLKMAADMLRRFKETNPNG